MSSVQSGWKAGRASARALVVGAVASATLIVGGCSEKDEPDVQPPTVPTPSVTTPGTATAPGTTVPQPAPPTATTAKPKQP